MFSLLLLYNFLSYSVRVKLAIMKYYFWGRAVRLHLPILGCCSFLQILASLSNFWKSETEKKFSRTSKKKMYKGKNKQQQTETAIRERANPISA